MTKEEKEIIHLLAKKVINIQDQLNLLVENLALSVDDEHLKVYDDKEVYDDFTIDEAIDFFKQISVTSFELIQNHFDSAPKLEHTLEYTNNKGTKRSIKLSGIQDFF